MAALLWIVVDDHTVQLPKWIFYKTHSVPRALTSPRAPSRFYGCLPPIARPRTLHNKTLECLETARL